ncbi:MAG: PEP motif-containing protein, putative exosortase substrate, partial [Gammaproteobacteria bacterium]|nr:PEP motif-containing protein, putative exosortase substrate [Gammaproteobacteria bacterium]
RPLLVYGKYRDAGRKAAIMLHGQTGAGEYAREFEFARDNVSAQHKPIQWLWARMRIAGLSDYYWGDPEDNREAITSLGLQYSLLTRYTSFVAVDEIIRNKGAAARNVKQPLPMPANVSNLAIGERRNVPEPSLTFMMGLLLITYLAARLQKRFR